MPDFTRPEYRSYVDLCAQLRLPRVWVDGDHYAQPRFEPRPATWDINVRCERCEGEWGYRPDPDWVWLPQLSDWLDMLSDTDARYFRLYDCSKVRAVRSDGWMAKCILHDGPETKESSVHGPTYEEAAARLAIAVGAVRVPSEGPTVAIEKRERINLR